MTLSLYTLAGLFLLGVSPFAIMAAYFFEQRRKLAGTVAALQTNLAAARAKAAGLERACHRNEAEARRFAAIAARLAGEQPQPTAADEAVVPCLAALGSVAEEAPVPREVAPETSDAARLVELEALATEHVIAYLVLAQAAMLIQQRLDTSRAEILRLDTELRRRPAPRDGSDTADVSDDEWAAIVTAAATQPSRTQVARVVFGAAAKAAYPKVKHVCDAEGLLMPESHRVVAPPQLDTHDLVPVPDEAPILVVLPAPPSKKLRDRERGRQGIVEREEVTQLEGVV